MLLPFSRRLRPVRRTAGEEIEHGHPDGDAVGHLWQDHAVGAVGDIAIDLNPAIHWAGVEDDEIFGSFGQPLSGHSEDPVVLPQGWDKSRLHSLELKSQDIESISPLDGILDPGKDCNAEVLDVSGKQGRRSADADFGPDLEKPPDVASRYPRVQDVAADR